MSFSNTETGISEWKCDIDCANLSAVYFIYELVITYCFVAIVWKGGIGVHKWKNHAKSSCWWGIEKQCLNFWLHSTLPISTHCSFPPPSTPYSKDKCRRTYGYMDTILHVCILFTLLFYMRIICMHTILYAYSLSYFFLLLSHFFSVLFLTSITICGFQKMKPT